MSERTKLRLSPASWLFGLLLLVAVIMVARHFMDAARLVALLRSANPWWLLVAAGLQFCTYCCASLVLLVPLRFHQQRQAVRSLLPLSLAKQFITQAVPSIGMSGNLFIIQGLERRGVSRGIATHAVLMGLLGHYHALAISMVLMLFIFWSLRELSIAILIPTTALFVLVVLVCLAVFWLGERANEVLPTRLIRFPGVGTALEAFREAHSAGLWKPRLVLQTSLLEFAILMCDTATLYVLLFAIGAKCQPAIVFAGFIAASVVAMIGLIPGGLGTFEGTCVAVLHVHGVSVEAALACTLLLRGFTFWLPMLPGLWLARRELTIHPRPSASCGRGSRNRQ